MLLTAQPHPKSKKSPLQTEHRSDTTETAAKMLSKPRTTDGKKTGPRLHNTNGEATIYYLTELANSGIP
jgi:hypothetical protein